MEGTVKRPSPIAPVPSVQKGLPRGVRGCTVEGYHTHSAGGFLWRLETAMGASGMWVFLTQPCMPDVFLGLFVSSRTQPLLQPGARRVTTPSAQAALHVPNADVKRLTVQWLIPQRLTVHLRVLYRLRSPVFGEAARLARPRR